MLRGLAGRLLILDAMPDGGAGLSTRMKGKRRYGEIGSERAVDWSRTIDYSQ
jgi:hypothetical protein